MSIISLVFPHHLFEDHPLFSMAFPVHIIEEYLYFNQFPFHKKKIQFHRATMKAFEQYARSRGLHVKYIDATTQHNDIRDYVKKLGEEGVEEIHHIQTTDDWLSRRLKSAAKQTNIKLVDYDSPMFLNTRKDLKSFFKKDKKKYFQTTFYKQQRKKRGILLTGDENPVGGKWSFDAENRKKYPKGKIAPKIDNPTVTDFHSEALKFVNQHFSTSYGTISDAIEYPIDFESSKQWFRDFLRTRFEEFGTYEDAILSEEYILHHSVLSPLLNVGLLTPNFIIPETLAFSDKHTIPINSVEGFIRQIIGWREFIRGVYAVHGREERTRNYWEFSHPMPKSFYDGTTGILPVDRTIKKVLKTGYCHHIERLMVLGNFMLLCEIRPDDVYQWFMELFIDAYDWVMVPNVYGMSQFADGGLMSTKPYISSSNYILKMSNYTKGDWQDIWDGLFWRFMDKHRDFFLSNPRLGMLIRTFDKMSSDQQLTHLNTAQQYLDKLHQRC